jgi:ribosomal protein S18 acetylase RimI-like enzyme
MTLGHYEVNDAFLIKLDEFNFTPYIKEKIGTGLGIYKKMKQFYGDEIPYEQFIFFLMNDSRKIVAYRYIFFNKKEGFGSLFSIAVDPDYRNKGHAKNIIFSSIDLMLENGIRSMKTTLIFDEIENKYILKDLYDACKVKYPQIKFNIELSQHS